MEAQLVQFKSRLLRTDNATIRFLLNLNKNLEFQKCLLRFWSQLPTKSTTGDALFSELLDLFNAIFRALFPFPENSVKLLAKQYLESCHSCEGDFVAYEDFGVSMAQLAYMCMEFPNLQYCLSFLNDLFGRIYRKLVRLVREQQTTELDFKVEVEFFGQEQVEQALKPEQRFRKSFFPIYFRERFIDAHVNEEDPNVVIEYRMQPLEQIIPIGISAESVVTILQNNNFAMVEFRHLNSKQFEHATKIKLEAVTPASFLSALPNAQLVPEIGLHPTLCDYEPSERRSFNRFNKLLIREIQWSQYPTHNLKGEKLMINVKSDFFTEDDYQVDQISKVNKKLERKAITSKRSLLTSQMFNVEQARSSNPDKRPPKNYQLIQRTLLFELQGPKDPQRFEEALAELEPPAEVLPHLNEYISKFISAIGRIPTDSKNPYEDDVIDYANRPPQQILLVGKPRSGRSTFCKALAAKLDLELLDLDRGIQKILAKVAENEQSPQLDDEGNPKEFLNPVERETYDNLRFGRDIPLSVLEQLLNKELDLDAPKNKGFILDLPLEEPYWVNSILGNKLILPKIGCRYFTHVVCLNQDDDDVRLFARKLMEKQDDLGVTSQFDREEQKRPKIKYRDPNDPDQDDDDQPADDDEKPPIVEEKDLFYRPLDIEDLDVNLERFNQQLPKLMQLYEHLPESNIVEIQAAGLTVSQLVDTVATRSLRGEPLRPLAIKLEGGGSEKDLLSLNLTEEKMFRMWSQWQQTDAVELLLKDKVIPGKVEFACDYAGRVFLFDNEENQNKFLSQPRLYLKKPPELPKTYIVSVCGPKGSGKNTIGARLAEHYGWKLVDVEDIVRQKLQAQAEFEKVKHVPSTFDPRINDIHLTEAEWKEFCKGSVVKDVLPMVLNWLGLPLQRKPPGWGEPKKEDEDQQQDDEEEKKRKEKEAKKLAAAKKKKEEIVEVLDEQARPATPPAEDVPTKEIIPQLDAELKVPESSKPKGIVLLGYPTTQEQVDQLNLFGIRVDKVITLVDKSEEPGQILLSRNPDLNYELESQLQGQTSAVLKEAYSEDNVKEVGIEGSKEEVWNRVRIQLDPYYVRADDEGLVRVPGDVQDGEDPLVFGDFAHYCPVTLTTSGWLVPGKEELVALTRGRVYRFYGEKEQNQFKDNVHLFIGKQPTIPPPRIMVIGIRGCGLRTQLKILNRMYKLPILNLKDNLIQNLEIHKKNRQQARYFNKGFKPKELDADGKEIPDAEIMDDPQDFDRKIHEVEVISKILDCAGVIINGNFFDASEEVISTPMVDLLVEAKKLPELVLFIKVEADNFLKRNFNQKIIEDEYKTKMEELRQRRAQERQEAYQKAIEDGVPEDQLPSLEPGNEEEDPEAPKLDDMLKEQRDKLLQQHEGDLAKLEDLQRTFEELKIAVRLISSDTTVENVTERLRFEIDPIVDDEQRRNMLEKWQCQKLTVYPDPENFKLNKLELYEKSYTHRRSRFGDRNPITMQNVPHIRDFPMLYRNRIFYFDSEEQRDMVCQKPLKYLAGNSVPTDVQIKPLIFVLGKYKSGKTEISKLLAEKLGLVRLKVSALLEEFIVNQRDVLSTKAREQLMVGGVEQELVIQILKKRLQLKDVYEQGCIIDGYPRTVEEAGLLSKMRVIPTAVIICERDNYQILRNRQNKFGGILDVLHMRLMKDETDLIGCYYRETFNNVRCIRVGQASEWGLLSICTKYIHSLLLARAQLARALIKQEPVRVSALTISKRQIIEKLSPLLNYCPVMVKANKNFYASNLRSLHLLYFDDQLYLLSSEETEADFIKNPNNYAGNRLSNYKVPQRVAIGQKCEAQSEYKGHCPVELLRSQLVKGCAHLLVVYKELQYSFASEVNLREFELQPKQFKHVRLPDKLPLNPDQAKQKNIAKKVAKRGDCTSYLELHLKNIIIRVLAQLGYQRLKYPRLSCKETVLKFIAISLKANNKNKDAAYRAKYQAKLERFLEHCSYAHELLSAPRGNEIDEERFLEKAEVFDKFMREMESSEKRKYFQQFIK